MFKKMLSILLAFAMLLSMIPASYAEDDITIAEESSEAEDILIVDDDADIRQVLRLNGVIVTGSTVHIFSVQKCPVNRPLLLCKPFRKVEVVNAYSRQCSHRRLYYLRIIAIGRVF